MARPSRRFCARPYALHTNLRDVVLAGAAATASDRRRPQGVSMRRPIVILL